MTLSVPVRISSLLCTHERVASHSKMLSSKSVCESPSSKSTHAPRVSAMTAFTASSDAGELQAMAWQSQNRPNFATNKIEVTCSYNDRTRRLGPAKSEGSLRTVDMVPSVRQTLLELQKSSTNPLVF